jgi:hypothetical protein
MACGPQSTPNFTAGGNLFGRLAAQWNAYFAAKVDANGGCSTNQTLINPVIDPAPGVTTPAFSIRVAGLLGAFSTRAAEVAVARRSVASSIAAGAPGSTATLDQGATSALTLEIVVCTYAGTSATETVVGTISFAGAGSGGTEIGTFSVASAVVLPAGCDLRIRNTGSSDATAAGLVVGLVLGT